MSFIRKNKVLIIGIAIMAIMIIGLLTGCGDEPSYGLGGGANAGI